MIFNFYNRFFRLDYCGIAILIIGSVVPLLYYQFYCEFGTKIAYLSLIGLLGITCIVISLWDRFASSDYRVYRVCVYIVRRRKNDFGHRIFFLIVVLFITFGIFGIIPTCHYVSRHGFEYAFTAGATQYLLLVGALYIIGAGLYAARIPERLAPGLFDIWFQSHQLFHVFVVAAACVHYYGICVLSHNQTSYFGDCRTDILSSSTGSLASLIN
ncbi:unnamed protein product [Rotaria magnacalcarata]|uniref:Uncharacterized protein n=1 Tax=Rotaria magnacalcarata TaxID=392030 RepID=A0A8S3HTB4_9BILA|nr:unnamed protein product [Rotaria magnacalcarata]